MASPYRYQDHPQDNSPFVSTNDIPLNQNRIPAPHSYADEDVPYNGQWREQSERSGGGRKWIVIGAVAAIIIIIVGVVAGVVVSKNHKSSSSSSGKSSNTVSQTDPNDPSTFVKNPEAYHQSFYGLAYTPKGSQLPECGNSLADVIQDVQIMSQLTTRIRLYGADCNQSALVLEAIQQTKVNMSVWLGNYPVATDNNAAYERQRDLIKSAIQTYGTDHIAGVTVGNEFILNYLNANGGKLPNDDIGNAGAAILIADIQDTRKMLADLSLSKTPQVGTSDAGSYFNTEVLQAVDYGMANVHPWFANTTVQDGPGWTYNFFQETNVQPAALLSNKPDFYIAEVGWPSKSSDAGNANNGGSDASVPNLQIFLDEFVCASNTNGTKYFYFEFFDEQWKDAQFGGVEGWWGLFNEDRTMKDIKIPNCPLS